ncbi:hypothetical protein PSTT_00938, partial [Puccinia striiformis]
PLIWQLREYLSKLRSLRTGGLPQNAEYVQKIWWRISSVHEVETVWPEFQEQSGRGRGRHKNWSEISRSTKILGILEMCMKVTSLDLDLRPTKLDKQSREFTIDENEATSNIFYPVSRLTKLTSLALTAPKIKSKLFNEDFIVRLIRDIVGGVTHGMPGGVSSGSHPS